MKKSKKKKKKVFRKAIVRLVFGCLIFGCGVFAGIHRKTIKALLDGEITPEDLKWYYFWVN